MYAKEKLLPSPLRKLFLRFSDRININHIRNVYGVIKPVHLFSFGTNRIHMSNDTFLLHRVKSSKRSYPFRVVFKRRSAHIFKFLSVTAHFLHLGIIFDRRGVYIPEKLWKRPFRKEYFSGGNHFFEKSNNKTQTAPKNAEQRANLSEDISRNG